MIVKRFKNKFLTLLTLLFATGCATIYQKEGFFTNGYSDFRVGDDLFTIVFHANEQTNPEVVYNFALKRAAEVTLKHDYLYFAIIEKTSTQHYPSIRLTIQCFRDAPFGVDAIDAKMFCV